MTESRWSPGSGGAMGRAIALRLAQEGAAIVVNDISQRRADETGALLAAAGRRFTVVRGNVTQ